jgi:hypothetical protein
MILKKISQAEVFKLLEDHKELSMAHKFRPDLAYVTKEVNLCVLFFNECRFSSGRPDSEIESSLIRELIKNGYPYRFGGFEDVYSCKLSKISSLAFELALMWAGIPYRFSLTSRTVLSLPLPQNIQVLEAIRLLREGRLEAMGSWQSDLYQKESIGKKI